MEYWYDVRCQSSFFLKALFYFFLRSKKIVINKFFSIAFLVVGVSLLTYAQPPTITSFLPATVCQGDAVTITGTNFTGATNVKLGSLNAASFVVNSATSITATVANLALTGTVTVTTPAGTATGTGNLTILPAPRPALVDVGTSDPWANCDGSSTYQLTVRNNSATTGTGNVYQIDWGDGTPFFTQTDWPFNAQTSHTFLSQGYFTIVLTITPPNGCTKSISYNFYNGKNPIASFTTTSSTTGLCAPANITFKVGNWFTNSKGTTYQIDFGDGSPLVTLPHPLNLTNTDELVPHTYTSTSCPSRPDFTATLKAINGCFTTTYTLNQIIVRKKPVADFSVQSACTGTPVCFTNLTIGGYSGNSSCVPTTSYLWDFGDGTTSTLQNPPCHTYPSGTNTFTVTLTTSNTSCGSDTKTKQITINPTPNSPTASSNSPICSGDSLKLFADTVISATYSWTGPGFTSTLRNPVRPNATTAMSGTYSVRITVNGCISAPATVAVTVNAKPNPPTVTSPVIYCQGATTVALTATPSSGHTLLWYSSATGGTGSPIATTPQTTNLGSTTYYVSQINSTNQCESNRAAIVVNIIAVPNISSVTFTNPTTCSSSTGSIVLSGLTPNTSYSVSYSKNGGTPTVVNLTSNSSGVITIGNLSAGTYDNIKATLSGCASNVVGPVVLADPNPPPTPTAGNSGPVCSGGTLNLASSSPTPGVTYSWTGPNLFASTLQNPIITNVTIAAGGTYSVTVKLNGCTSLAATTTVVVNPKPAKPVVTCPRPVSYCFNQAPSPFCVTAITGHTLVWCTNYPSGCSPATLLPRTDTVSTICYSVYQQNDTTNCKSDTAQICVIVSARITNNSIKSDQTLCAAGSIPSPLTQTSGSVGGGNGTFSYKWEQSTDGITWVSAGTNSTYSPSSLSVTTLYRRIVFSGSCSDTSNTVTISIGGFSNSTIAASQSICAGTVPNKLTGSYPTGGNGTFAFQWETSASNSSPWSPASGTFNSQDYQPPALTTTTYYRRKDSSAGCFTYTAPVKITVYEKPLAGTIRPDTTVCAGSTVTITSGLIKGNIKKWQYHPLPVTNLWIDATGTNNTITFPNVQASFAVRLIVVSDGFGQGCDLADTSNIVYISVSQKAIGGNTDADASVCSGSNAGTVILSNYTGQIIRWDSSKNNGASWGAIANTTASLSYNNIAATTWYRAVVKNNGCAEAFSDTTIIMVVGSVTIANAGADQKLCNVDSIILNANAPALGSGTWRKIFGTGGSISNTSLPNTPVTGLQPGTYGFVWTISGTGLCTGSSDTVEIKIWPFTTTANAGNDTLICDLTSAQTIQLRANSARPLETAKWSVLSGPGGSFSDIANPASTFTFSQPGSYKLAWRISNDSTGGCPLSEDIVMITVYEKPLAGSITPALPTICAGDSVALFYTSVSGVIVKWQYNLTPLNPGSWRDANTTAAAISFRNVQSSFAVRIIVGMPGASANCSFIADTSKPVLINVNPAPPVSIKVLPSLIQQQPDYTFSFKDTVASVTPLTHLWDMGDKTLQTRSGKEITYTYADTGIYKVKLLVTDFSNGCKASDFVTVKILYVPGYLYIPNAMCAGCSNNSLRHFLPLGKGLKEYRLRIYSKWGQVVFETTKLNPDGSPSEAWKGDFQNPKFSIAEQNAYWWVAEGKYSNGTEWKGMVYPPGTKYVKSAFITFVK